MCRFLLIIMAMILLISACSMDKDALDNNRIVVALPIVKMAVHEIAKDNFKVSVLFNSEDDYSKNKLSRSQIKTLDKAKLIILMGNGYEDKYSEQLKPFENKIVYLSHSMNQIRMNQQYKRYWIDFDSIINMVRIVKKELSIIDQKNEYEYNAKTLEIVNQFSQIIKTHQLKPYQFKLKPSVENDFIKSFFINNCIMKETPESKVIEQIRIDTDLKGKYTGIIDYISQQLKQFE